MPPKMKKTPKKRAALIQRLRHNAAIAEDSSDSDHSMSLLASDTQAKVPCNAVVPPESPLLYD